MRAIDVLRQAQWGPHPVSDISGCPWCLQEKRNGHTSACPVGQLLKRHYDARPIVEWWDIVLHQLVVDQEFLLLGSIAFHKGLSPEQFINQMKKVLRKSKGPKKKSSG